MAQLDEMCSEEGEEGAFWDEIKHERQEKLFG